MEWHTITVIVFYVHNFGKFCASKRWSDLSPFKLLWMASHSYQTVWIVWMNETWWETFCIWERWWWWWNQWFIYIFYQYESDSRSYSICQNSRKTHHVLICTNCDENHYAYRGTVMNTHHVNCQRKSNLILNYISLKRMRTASKITNRIEIHIDTFSLHRYKLFNLDFDIAVAVAFRCCCCCTVGKP